jgi:hypothetical protein
MPATPMTSLRPPVAAITDFIFRSGAVIERGLAGYRLKLNSELAGRQFSASSNVHEAWSAERCGDEFKAASAAS